MKLKSSTITNKKKKLTYRLSAADRKLPPIPPGKILKEELMEPYGLSANQLAQMLGVATNRIAQIIKGEREITVDTAMRLARCFNMSPEFWLNLQMRYELEKAEDQDLTQHINGVVKVFSGKLPKIKSPA